MPRILSPDEPRGPAPVINLPRPREVRPAPSGLADFGQALTASGDMLLRHTVEQERSAAQTRLTTLAVERIGELENEIDSAGTASEGRTLLDERMPRLMGELQQEATDAGLPEFADQVGLLARRSEISTRASLAKRGAQESLDALGSLAQAYEGRFANARTTADLVGLRGELQTAIVRVVQSNPLLSAGAGQELFQSTVERGVTRFVSARIDRAVAAGDESSLRALMAQVGDVPNLPEDTRARAERTIDAAIQQVEAQREADARKQGAIAASNLYIGIVDATNPGQLLDIREQAEALFKSGAIAPDTRVSLITKAETKRQDLLSGLVEIADIAGRFDAGLGLNSTKEATKLYEALAPAVPPEQLPAFLSEFTIQSGFPPQQGIDLLHRAERVDDPTQLALAADYVKTVKDRSPGAAMRIDVDARVDSTVATAEVLGISTQDAAALVIDQTPDTAVLKRREEEFNKEFSDFTPLDFLRDHDIAPDFWFSADPVVADRLLLEAEETMRRAWMMTGNRETAEQAAANLLKRRYALTDVGGRTHLTEIPPEPFGQLLFKGTIEAEPIARAVDAEIETLLKEAEIELPEAPEDMPRWELRADERTRSELAMGQPLSWQLWILADDLGNMRRIPTSDGSGYVRYVLPDHEQFKQLAPVQEALRDSFRRATEERVSSTRQDVLALEARRLVLLPQAETGVSGAADQLAEVERQLEEARQRQAEAETRLGP